MPRPKLQPGLLQEFTQLQERFLRTTNALASAAHDLKTPLSILNGYVEMLQSEKLGRLNDRQREVLRDMRSNGQRLQRYIQDFLSFSVLETGEMKMKFEPGDINALSVGGLPPVVIRFQEKGLALYFLANEKLTISLLTGQSAAGGIESSGECIQVHACRRHGLAACRTIYVGTAQRGKSATIRRSVVGRRLRAPNSVKISVSDTGPGIPPEYHMEVFDDFFRLPQNETADGMGLGLAIARRLVGHGRQDMGGERPGAGCKFSFIVPLLPPHPQPTT